jgi:ABC-2 type transport system permease protein
MMLMAIGILVFGVRVASWPALVAAVGCSAFCFVGIMMFMSVLGKTEQAVAGAGWAILLVMSMTGGGMVPLMMMPTWMYKIGSISAVKWSVLALEGAIWRGFGPAEMMFPLGVLLGIGATGLAVGTLILSRSD